MMKRLIGFGGFFLFAIVILFAPSEDKLYWNSLALGGLMVLFWLFEVLPIYVTALFPFVLAIPLGVLDSSDLTSAYGHKYVYLFFGGFVLSLALEKWNVHKQIAEGIIRVVGTSKVRILLGFLLSTALLSMWISNTATALMMLPMATAILSNIESESNSKFPIFLLLTVAYGASIGGMATLVGSPPNIQMAGLLEEAHGISISFFDWMRIGLPISMAMLLLVFGFFYLMMGEERRHELHAAKSVRKKWNANQLRVVVLFLTVVFLWAFRKPLTDYTGLTYTDEGVAVFGAIVLFFLPSTENKPLLEWRDTSKISWGILILFGGGMALASMLGQNGVIDQLAGTFANFNGASLFVLLIVLVTIAIFGTELMSNLALVSVLVPVVAEFALDTEFSIIQLCLPITLASSCAFMLPVGTPPNAIVFSSGKLTINQMARTGFVLNLIGVLVVVLLSILLIH